MMKRKNVNIMQDKFGGQDYAFTSSSILSLIANDTSMATMSRQIVVLGCFKHMTPYKYSFDTYEAISASNVILVDSGTCKAIEIGSIIVEMVVNRKINRIKFQKHPSCTQDKAKSTFDE